MFLTSYILIRYWIYNKEIIDFFESNHKYGKKIFHIGPSRDEIFFEGINEEFPKNVQIDRVPFNMAEGIVCTGLFDDEVETPSDYTEQLLEAKNRGLKMLCANPDIQVDRGTHQP